MLPALQHSVRWYGRHVACWLLVVTAGTACFNARGGDDSAPMAQGHELNLTSRSVVWPIEAETPALRKKKFVQIEIAEVLNPEKIPLSFAVHSQSPEGEKSLLGTFSLFPPDNPGGFIIATQGKLQTGGVIIVDLIPLQAFEAHHDIQVRIHRISLIED
jgi:hypothetical protein